MVIIQIIIIIIVIIVIFVIIIFSPLLCQTKMMQIVHIPSPDTFSQDGPSLRTSSLKLVSRRIFNLT